MAPFAKRIYQFWREVVLYFIEIGGTTRAAALAYTTLVSLVPLVVVSLGILTAFPVFDEYAQKISHFAFNHFIAASADVVESTIQTFAKQAAGLSATGLLFLLVGAVMLIFTMENAFNAIWRAPTRRHNVSAFLMYWAVLTLLPVLAGTGLAVSVYLTSLPYIEAWVETITGVIPVLHLLPLLLGWAGFTVLYIALPNTKVLARHAMFGGFIASLSFEAIKAAFAFYVTHMSSYTLIYGALAAIPIFLLWLYIAWLITIAGAVVAYVAGDRQKRVRTK